MEAGSKPQNGAFEPSSALTKEERHWLQIEAQNRQIIELLRILAMYAKKADDRVNKK